MALSETAELAVLLKLQDQMSGPLKTVNARVAELEAGATSASTKGVGNLSKGVKSLGGALDHAKHQIGGLLTGPLGFLGLTAGILSIGGAIEQSVSKAQTWGLQIEKLQGITHDTAEQLSGLLAVTEKYGLSNERLSQIAGFTEKSLGNIQTKAKGASDFLKKYGFAITDAHGKTKDFATLLLTFSDYWDKSTNASQKAAAAAKLFGRGYADLVPVLNLGSKGIQDAIDEAKQLGLTLTQDNVEALAKAREATRQWGDALGGLELQIGLTLLPAITELAKTATKFVSENRGQIVGFFRDGAKFAGEMGAAIHDDVLPIFGAIKSAWDAVPDPLKKLLIAGFIARGTTKFLFGFDPIKFGFDKLFKGGLFSRGSSPANPLWVTSAGGGAGGPGGAAGGLAAFLGPAALAAIAYAIGGTVETSINKAISDRLPAGSQATGNAALNTTRNLFFPGFDTITHLDQLPGIIQRLPGQIADAIHDPRTLIDMGKPGGSAVGMVTRAQNAIYAAERAATAKAISGAIETGFLRVLDASKMTHYLGELKDRLSGLKKDLNGQKPGSEGAKLVAAKIEAVKAKEDQVRIAINAMKNSTNPRLQAVQNRIALDGIRLRSLTQRLHIAQDAHDSARAARLRERINAVKHDQDIANAKLQRIANKKTTFTSNITNNFSPVFSVRSFQQRFHSSYRISKQFGDTG